MPYEGPNGIGALLRGLQRFGWEPVEEDGNVIALTCGACNITLEPGGQFELSGAPVETIHQTCDEVQTHLKQVKEVGNELGIGMLGMGFDPKSTRDEVPWMPKGRYKIMRDQMLAAGKLGLDMMLRTCTVQVNLDFESEADMVRKLRVSLALQPVATALFANSPFTEGKPNGYPELSQPISGPIPIPTAPACCPSPSSPAWASSAMSTTCSTCRCISSTATGITSTPPASPSAISWWESCPLCRARSRAWAIGSII